MCVGERGGGREGEGKASQVVLEQSTSSNAVHQSHRRSCHIIKFSTNIKKLTCFSFFFPVVESYHSFPPLCSLSPLSVCMHSSVSVCKHTHTHTHARVILCEPLHQTDRHFIEVVFNACLDITVAGSSIRLQDNIDHLP